MLFLFFFTWIGFISSNFASTTYTIYFDLGSSCVYNASPNCTCFPLDGATFSTFAVAGGTGNFSDGRFAIINYLPPQSFFLSWSLDLFGDFTCYSLGDQYPGTYPRDTVSEITFKMGGVRYYSIEQVLTSACDPLRVSLFCPAQRLHFAGPIAGGVISPDFNLALGATNYISLETNTTFSINYMNLTLNFVANQTVPSGPAARRARRAASLFGLPLAPAVALLSLLAVLVCVVACGLLLVTGIAALSFALARSRPVAGRLSGRSDRLFGDSDDEDDSRKYLGDRKDRRKYLDGSPRLPRRRSEDLLRTPEVLLASAALDAPRSPHPIHSGGALAPWELRFEDLEIQYPPIGRGACGLVHRASYRGTMVAVKILTMPPAALWGAGGRNERADDDRSEGDFNGEMELLATLRHPNIVLFIGVCLAPQRCLVTELVERGSLLDVMGDMKRRGVRWEEGRLWRVALQICQGMAYLHGREIIHRDLKSPNILVKENWEVKIADFGMSRTRDLKTMTQVGTLRWLAPEIIDGDGKYDERVDVYSFGMVLYEMLTFRVPFDDIDEEIRVMKAMAEGQRVTLPRTEDGQLDIPYDKAWGDLFARATEENPERRPSFIQLIALIERIGSAKSY